MGDNMDEKQSIFRKSAPKKLNSPEQLNDYLKVTTPSVWIVLAAVMILLAGFFIWSANSQLEHVVTLSANVENGKLTAVIVSEDSSSAVRRGQTIHVLDDEGTDLHVDEISRDPAGRKVACAQTDLPDGEYTVQIVTDTMTPISFLLG